MLARGWMPISSARIVGFIAAFACVGALRGVAGCVTDADRRNVPDPEAPEGPPVDPTPVGRAPVGRAEAAKDDGLGAAAPRAPDDSTIAPHVVAPFHIIGRFDARDPAGPRFGWAGTEIRVRFAGARLALELADTGISHYDVAIDGAAPRLLVVFGGRRTYEVARDLPPGIHELVLTKRTETFTGVTQLLGVEGTLIPSEAPSGRRIELVGDSITCGFGVLGPDPTCAFSPDTEAEPRAWGAIAAKELGAMRMVTAVSGMGVFRNFDGSTSDTMPERYDRALAEDPTSVWDHRAFEPDLVVVNLGTNDFAGGKGDPGPAFEAAYTKFLGALRARHAAARIVVTTSPMLSGRNHAQQRAYVEAAIAARAAEGDTKISLVDLETQDGLDGYGCAYHPSIATHQKMAAKLVQHVKPLMGW